jgi:hypothetical protein
MCFHVKHVMSRSEKRLRLEQLILIHLFLVFTHMRWLFEGARRCIEAAVQLGRVWQCTGGSCWPGGCIVALFL